MSIGFDNKKDEAHLKLHPFCFVITTGALVWSIDEARLPKDRTAFYSPIFIIKNKQKTTYILTDEGGKKIILLIINY